MNAGSVAVPTGDFGWGNNPLLWLITLGFLGNRGGLMGDNAPAAGVAVNDTLNRVSQDVSAAAVQGANQTTALQQSGFSNTQSVTEAINRAAADAAACCCNTRLDAANQGSMTRESITQGTFANQMGLANLGTSVADKFASLQLQNCTDSKDMQAAMAACCCETQKELLRQTAVLESKGDQIMAAMQVQTMTLAQQSFENTQKILDQARDNREALLMDQLSQCRQELSNCQQTNNFTAMMSAQTAALTAAIQAACGGNGG